jgi:hypothetical protein
MTGKLNENQIFSSPKTSSCSGLLKKDNVYHSREKQAHRAAPGRNPMFCHCSHVAAGMRKGLHGLPVQLMGLYPAAQNLRLSTTCKAAYCAPSCRPMSGSGFSLMRREKEMVCLALERSTGRKPEEPWD